MSRIKAVPEVFASSKAEVTSSRQPGIDSPWAVLRTRPRSDAMIRAITTILIFDSITGSSRSGSVSLGSNLVCSIMRELYSPTKKQTEYHNPHSRESRG